MSINVDIAGTGGGDGSFAQPRPRDDTPPDLPNPAKRSPVLPRPASATPPAWTIDTSDRTTGSPTPSNGTLGGWTGVYKRLAVIIGTPRGTKAGNIVVGLVSHDNKLHFEVHQMTSSGFKIPEARWYTGVSDCTIPRENEYGPVVPINLDDVDFLPQWLEMAMGEQPRSGKPKPPYKWKKLQDRVLYALGNGNPHTRATIMVQDPPRDMELDSL